MRMRHLRQLKIDLIKTLQTEQGCVVEKMIIEYWYPARLLKFHMLFDLLRIIESTGFAKRLSVVIYVLRSALIQSFRHLSQIVI